MVILKLINFFNITIKFIGIILFEIGNNLWAIILKLINLLSTILKLLGEILI